MCFTKKHVELHYPEVTYFLKTTQKRIIKDSVGNK
jgi:hypothetical protein